MARAGLFVLLLAGACAGDDHTLHIVCHAPAQPYYDCQPVASPDPNACTGGPSWRSAQGPDDAPLTTEDPDLAFPDGCTFHLNECGCCYETGRQFDCHAGQWVEPI